MEETVVGPGCKSWPGVIKLGIAPSFEVELVITAIDEGSDVFTGSNELGTVTALSEIGN